jgi:hypothetical protein
MTHDVFVSYSNQNKKDALVISPALEGQGIRCWIVPRDLAPGTNWAESILAAIKNARTMILVFSHHANQSQHVLREFGYALNTGMPIIIFRLEDLPYSNSFSYYLTSRQWLEVMSGPLQERITEMCDMVRKICPRLGEM